MKKLFAKRPRLSVLCAKEINPRVINAIYKSRSEWLGQYIAAICLEAPIQDLVLVFEKLGEDGAGELANILCAETYLLRKKFIRRNEAGPSFALYRSTYQYTEYITSIPWIEWASISKNQEMEKTIELYPPLAKTSH